METKFLPAVRLAGLFYREAVAPLLRECFPRLTHSAALIGTGSEVLGFDTARSMDHDWGRRGGAVFHDGPGPLRAPRSALSW